MIKTGIKEKKSDIDWRLTIFLGFCSLFVLLPLYFTVSIALKSPDQMADLLSFPIHPRWANIRDAIEVTNFFRILLNSLIITILSISGTLLTNSMVGYAIGRNTNSKLFNFFFYYFISALFVPFAVIMLPLVKQTSLLGMHNIPGLILLYVVYGLPFNVFLYTAYMKSVPNELDEAAMIDGASVFYTFWKLIFPLMKPINATVMILTGLWTWNDFILPLIILNVEGIKTLPLAQYIFQSRFSTNYNLAFSSYLLALLPMVIFYLIAQKWIVKGIIQGSIK